MDASRDGARVGRVHERAGDARLDVGGRTAGQRRHDGQPSRHGLDDGQSELLLEAATGVGAAGRDEVAPAMPRDGKDQASLGVAPVSEQDDPVAESRVPAQEGVDAGQLGGLAGRRVVEVAADDDEVRSGAQGRVEGEGLDDAGHALDLVQSSDAHDDGQPATMPGQSLDGSRQVVQHRRARAGRERRRRRIGLTRIHALGHDRVARRTGGQVDAHEFGKLSAPGPVAGRGPARGPRWPAVPRAGRGTRAPPARPASRRSVGRACHGARRPRSGRAGRGPA